MRLKPLVAWIMKSRTYQLSATPDPTNADDEANFSHAVVRAAAGRGAARRDQPGPRRARTFPHAPASLRAAQLPGAVGRRRVPEDVRQARPAADLRVRAVRVDHAGPGVPDDQRRDGRDASWSAIEPDRHVPGCGPERLARSWTSSIWPRSAASRRRAERTAVTAHIGAAPATGARPGKTSSGRCSTAKSSCCGIESFAERRLRHGTRLP